LLDKGRRLEIAGGTYGEERKLVATEKRESVCHSELVLESTVLQGLIQNFFLIGEGLLTHKPHITG